MIFAVTLSFLYTIMLTPKLLNDSACLKERQYFTFHDLGLPTVHDAVTGPHSKQFPAGQLVDVIGHHIASDTSLIRIRNTQYHTWLNTDRLHLHSSAPEQ